MHPSQPRETAFNTDQGKHGQREILERRDIRQVPNKRRIEVQSQNRDLLMRDVCTSLALWGPPTHRMDQHALELEDPLDDNSVSSHTVTHSPNLERQVYKQLNEVPASHVHSW